jgi:uncharacterized membrane protein
MPVSSLPLAVVAMVLVALADFSIRQSAGRISPSLGAFIYSIAALAVLGTWTLVTRLREPLEVTTAGLAWSISTGLFFGAFTGVLFALFAAGASLSVTSPAVRIGGIAIASALGLLVLGEPLSARYALGVAVTAIGIAIVLTA